MSDLIELKQDRIPKLVMHEEVESLGHANRLLEEADFDNYEGAKLATISGFRLGMIEGSLLPLGGFVVNNRWIKMFGTELALADSPPTSRIVVIKCSQQHSLLFGRGFRDTSAFETEIKRAKTEKEKVEVAVRQFSKQLYGKIPGKQNF